MHWSDTSHESDGHGLDAESECHAGEELLDHELKTLYMQNGVQMAYDDVSGAALEPGLVHEARGTEIAYFKGMGVYERVPRSEQSQTLQK